MVTPSELNLMWVILQNNCYLQTSLFLNEVWNYRINFKYLDNIMANMDKKPIFLIQPTKTIAKKGGKPIIIQTKIQKKYKFSVLLTIIAEGSKLPPFLIFKGKANGVIVKDLNKDENVVSGNGMSVAMRMPGVLRKL